MAKIITQHDLPSVTGQIKSWCYNSLDCTITHEVHNAIHPRLDPMTDLTYRFEMAQQAPAMAMMLRGVAVDHKRRTEGIAELSRSYVEQEDKLNELVAPWWDKKEKDTGSCPTPKRKDGKHSWPRSTKGSEPGSEATTSQQDLSQVRCEACSSPRLKLARFNAKSSPATKHLLYDLLGLEKKYNKRGKLSADKEALSSLARQYSKHEALLLGIRDAKATWKLVGILKSGTSADGRLRSSFNVGAAETGRWSSSHTPTHKKEGTNLQNIPDSLRDMIIADPGHLLFYADLEQAESRIVAYISGDENYINAHLSGDVHTYVTRELWPELAWTGDMKLDKKLAEQDAPFDPGHTYRFNGKRIQHGTNYRLTPIGISRWAKLPLAASTQAWKKYHERYPAIAPWQMYNERLVREGKPTINPLGRRRYYYGRSWDPHTFRQAIAQNPQSCCVDVLNLGMWHVWNELDPVALQLLAQIHDAILGELLDDDRRDATLERVSELMTLGVEVTDIYGVTRTMTIPVDIQIGYNFKKFHPEKNPNGMRTWKPGVKIERVTK